MLDSFLRRVCAGFVLLFGFWTILANIAVQLDLAFVSLRSLAPVVLILAIAAVIAAHHFRRRDTSACSLETPEEPDFSVQWKNVVLVFCAGILGATYVFSHHYVIFWGLACLFLFTCYLAHLNVANLTVLPAKSKPADILLFFLAISVSVLATVGVHRPDADDSLYINMSVSVLDAPYRAMLATDTLHGIPGGFYLPTYRVHTVELLTALIADLTGLEPIAVAHLLLPPVFAFLSVCAAARLFQIFLRTNWAWAALVLVVVLIVARQTHWMYGNFAYVRLFQGKAVLVTLMIPLIVTYAIEFFTTRRMTNWGLLALAQISAVGFTANALYVAPIAAGLALAGCWRPSWETTRRVGFGLLASFYPLLLALLVKQEMAHKMLHTELVGKFLPLEDAVDKFFGSGVTQWAWLVTLTGAWALLRDPASRRWMIGFAFGFMLVFMNPLLDEFWAANLTGSHLIWRLFWVVPLPALLAILLTGTVHFGRSKGLAIKWTAVSAALLVMSIFVFGRPYANGNIVIGMPRLKVPPDAYCTAKLLVHLARPGESVLAPEEVSAWVPTFRGYPYPVVARRLYAFGQLQVFSAWIDYQSVKERLALLDYVSGSFRQTHSETLLSRWLRTIQIRAVAAPSGLKWLAEMSQALEQAGFISGRYLDYVVFYRGRQWPAEISPLLRENLQRPVITPSGSRHTTPGIGSLDTTSSYCGVIPKDERSVK
jgi:hypothetical protein